MTLHIHDHPQGSDEWLEARRGIITASVVGQLITSRTLTAVDFACPDCMAYAEHPCVSKRNGQPIKAMHPARAEYARAQNVSIIGTVSETDAKSLTMLLAAERITGWSEPTFISDDMWRGIDDEPIARGLYNDLYAPVAECGLMVEDRWGFQIGYSPDGLVGDDGLIEIKSPMSKEHLRTIIADQVPDRYMAQLQTGLLVTGRKWIDYISYCGGMPLWVKRVEPEPQWQRAIFEAVSRFEAAATEIVNTYRARVADLHPTERRQELEITV